MKRVISILGALVILMMVSLITSCGGGGGEVVVPPQVDIHPTPTITVTERLQQLGLTGLEALYDKYDNGYLRVEWQDPNPVLGDGDRTDYGAVKVFVKYYNLEQKAFVEVDITSFPEVQFLATAGNPTAGGDRLLWFLNWHEIELGGTIDITGTVRVWAEDFVAIWDRLNGGPLSSLEQSFAVTVETIDGIVRINDSNDFPLWIAVLAVGLSRVAPVAGWCPQIDKQWQVSREGEQPIPPANQLPVAMLEVDKTSGQAPLIIHFDASGSYDPDGTIVEYLWYLDYEPGQVGIDQMQVEYQEGVHYVKVRVKDNSGATAMSQTITITVTDQEQPVLTNLDLTPATASLHAGEDQQFVADATDQFGDPLAATFVWTLTGPGTLTQQGHYTAPSLIPVDTTATIKVTATYGGHSLEKSAIVYLLADEPTVPIWGDNPYDHTKVVLDVTPEAVTLHSGNLQTQQIFVDLLYDGQLVWNGSEGRYFEIQFSTNAPSGALTPDGLFDSVESGNGTFTITVTATLATVPAEHNIFTKVIPVSVIN